MNIENLLNSINQMGFSNASVIKSADISFKPELLEFCKMNSCGNYGRCYTCPPYVGEIDELVKKAQAFENAIIFQKVYPLEDSFDIEGMFAANAEFCEMTDVIMEEAKELDSSFLLLGAGGCRKCPKCGVVDGVPCRFPEDVYASLESYGIDVSVLASVAGMKYINGVNTTTFFGGLFY